MTLDPSIPAAVPEEPGYLMRQAREARGMHISFLANNLRVPVERLKALEDGRWNDLPDLVFARALAQSVCRQLKIDPAVVLAGMPDPDPLRSVRLTAATSQPLGGLSNGSVVNRNRWLMVGAVVVVILAWAAVASHVFDDGRPSTSVVPPEMPATQTEIVPAEEPPTAADSTAMGQANVAKPIDAASAQPPQPRPVPSAPASTVTVPAIPVQTEPVTKP